VLKNYHVGFILYGLNSIELYFLLKVKTAQFKNKTVEN
jgi:hypothetical protein